MMERVGGLSSLRRKSHPPHNHKRGKKTGRDEKSGDEGLRGEEEGSGGK